MTSHRRVSRDDARSLDAAGAPAVTDRSDGELVTDGGRPSDAVPAVRADSVGRRYGDVVALDDVSLAVDAGTTLALVGPNGAGKTTFVRSILGTTDATGTVELFGQSPDAVASERVGLLPQAFDPPAKLTAREVLDFYAGLYDDARSPTSILEAVGAAGIADRPYEACSGGERRRICVGAALVNDPDLLVVDEPTAAIDPAGRREIWTLFEDLVDRGTTLVLTTHDMAEAHRLADEVALLADGRLVAHDDPDDLVAAHGGERVLTIRGSSLRDAADNLDRPARLADDALVVPDCPVASVGAVLDRVTAAGATVTALDWERPTLEDVYLSVLDERGIDVGNADAGEPGIDAGNDDGADERGIDAGNDDGADERGAWDPVDEPAIGERGSDRTEGGR